MEWSEEEWGVGGNREGKAKVEWSEEGDWVPRPRDPSIDCLGPKFEDLRYCYPHCPPAASATTLVLLVAMAEDDDFDLPSEILGAEESAEGSNDEEVAISNQKKRGRPKGANKAKAKAKAKMEAKRCAVCSEKKKTGSKYCVTHHPAYEALKYQAEQAGELETFWKIMGDEMRRGSSSTLS